MHYTPPPGYAGLTESEVRQSRERHGVNAIVPPKRPNALRKILSLLKEPMFILLFATAAVYFFIGEEADGFLMLGFVVVIAGINLFQEWRTDHTLDALSALSAPKATVLRDGATVEVDTMDIVVGDGVLCEEGDIFPADGTVVAQTDLGADESMLTGESVTVWKTVGDVCYAGSVVVQGGALVEITHVGASTHFGRIGRSLESIAQTKTPLERQIARLITICALIGVGFFAVVFFVNYMHSSDIRTALLAGLTIAMAMIPEEFPVILTVFLSLGAYRLAKRNALVRRMASCETLGSVSVLCVDKTGTITENRMTVAETVTDCDAAAFNDAMIRACESHPFDPMEQAMLRHACDTTPDGMITHEYAFNTTDKMMGHIWRVGDADAHTDTLYAKGSPESILELCQLPAPQREAVNARIAALAAKGLRVIALGSCAMPSDDYPATLRDCTLDYMGLIGLYDPPRPQAKEAIAVCKGAGIRVVMITGDHADTARAIASDVGIDASHVVTGDALESMSDDELRRVVLQTSVFARVVPRQKMKIIAALQSNREIVAMTGDGINDAPALKLADIGVAMGGRGTNVAKEAADLVVLDDNLSTIVASIADGRRIYDNIQKAIQYCLVVHIPIALIAFLCPLLHLPLMLLPIHVVLLELIIDPTCSIIFERLPADDGILRRKPRGNAPLVSRRLVGRSIVQGAVILGAVLGTYMYVMPQGAEVARSMALIALIASNLILVYVNRTPRFVLARYPFDPLTLYINGGIIVAAALLLYLPPLANMAQTASLSLPNLAIAAAVGTVGVLWYEAVKAVGRVKHA